MDTLFFIASKLVWALIRPETLLILLLAAGLLALQFGRRRLAFASLAASLGGFVIIALFPLGDALLAPLEARYPPEPEIAGAVVGIVVLGGGEDARAAQRWGQPAVNETGERFLAAIALAGRFPQARVLFTGGSGALMGSESREARVAERILTSAGIEEERLLLEHRSRNTAENAQLSLKLLAEAEGGMGQGAWLLVTSAFHMPRAVASFCAAGWREIVPWPVDFRSGAGSLAPSWDLAGHLAVLNTAVKERVGLLAYRVTGRAGLADCLR
ncbi:MAG: YdcF family protein [Pseudomonadota bacterium]